VALSIRINGQARTFDHLASGASLQVLILSLNLKGDRIAIERNGDIVSRDERSHTLLEDGDRLEIVHFVGGGLQSLILSVCQGPQ